MLRELGVETLVVAADIAGPLQDSDIERAQVSLVEAERAALTEVNRKDFISFREDYEVYGASAGTIQFMYSGSCEKCHLAVEIDTRKPFWPEVGRAVAT